MKIGLILNTRQSSSEFEVEYDPPHTVELIKHGIESIGHECVFIEADENVAENIKLVKPDLVFNRSEGLKGESRESHVPAILEMLGIPYVGSNILTTSLALNKGWTKKILEYHKVRSPKFEIVSTIEEGEFDLAFPLILKPNEEGSSIGINEDNVVHSKSELQKKLIEMFKLYQQPILIEEFISGREISAGVIGNLNQGFEMLSLIEVDFSKFPSTVGEVFGQRAKTLYDDLDHYICPATLDDSLKKLIEETTIEICKILDVKDFARLDFRLNKDNELYFLEINPLPGMDFDLESKDFSFYPYMAFKSGYTYDQLIEKIITSTMFRYGIN